MLAGDNGQDASTGTVSQIQTELRDRVQMMAERGIALTHTATLRWVQRYMPEFEKRWNRYSRPVGRSWHLNGQPNQIFRSKMGISL
jgi:transposase-like protein